MNRRTALRRAAGSLAVFGLPGGLPGVVAGVLADDAFATEREGIRAGDPRVSDDIEPTAINALANAAREVERLHALVVMHRGQVVLAEAYRGPAVDEAVNVKSVSKSVVAALVGCALAQGVLSNVDATLGELASGLVPIGADPRVASLRVQDFLTMRIGLQRQSGRNYGQWAASEDWVHHALTRPFVAEPGGRMLYSTAGWHVLGALLSDITGRSLLSLARDWLGEPLDIAFAPWTRDPQGRYLGGNEMSMSPLEMARFGELYRLGGSWQGARVLGDGWVAQSFARRTVSPWSNDAYGYGWFLRSLGGYRAAYARGYGGQVIHVVPDAGVVVAMTSGTSRAARSAGYMGTLHGLVGDWLEQAGRPG